jgi:GWxTD domain-containing protein
VKIVMAILISLLVVTSVQAQVGLRPAAFYTDFASFAADSAGLDRLEIYYQIFTSQLLYAHEQDKFVAHYSVNAIIKKQGKQITATETEGFLKENAIEKTTGPKDFVINSFKFSLAPGKYQITVTLRDLNSDNTIPLQTEYILPNYKNLKTSVFSTIEFARDIKPVLPDTEAALDSLTLRLKHNFDHRQWQVIPSCSRIYGDNNSELRFYYEFYADSSLKDSLHFAYQITDNRDNVAASQTTEYMKPSAIGYIGVINLEHLKPGPYQIEITSPDIAKKKILPVKGEFRISWSAMALVENDYSTAIEQLRYIAKSPEIEKLKKAPKDERAKYWNDFWKSKDPSPSTVENEIRDEYYRRIAYANEHFFMPNKEGWKTDFGMIYVINGEPDERERHPFELESKSYEVWYYYNPNRAFLFIDINGYGEYVLQYPYDGDVNKRSIITGGNP